jgi:predicted RNA-binding Zn-ribbon protein involved in translation (DUF1610 family)
MEHQKQLVQSLQGVRARLCEQLDCVSNLLRTEEKKLEQLCQEKGHKFLAERDYHDCHASKTLYVCQQCGFVTMTRPTCPTDFS